MPDKYLNFMELKNYEIENIDYKIIQKKGKSSILIMAPHGGNIEPYTSQITEWIAGEDFSLYIFEGIKNNQDVRNLHITSHNFDEPHALEAAAQSELVLTIHGLKNSIDEFIMVGGLETDLGAFLKEKLINNGFIIKKSELKYSGRRPENICNRGLSGRGIQLEISFALRKRIYADNDCRDRFIGTVRSILFHKKN